MYYAIGQDLSVADYARKVTATITVALNRAKLRDALTGGVSSEQNALANIKEKLLPNWIAIGQAIAAGVPARLDETKWRELGAMYEATAADVRQYAKESGSVEVLKQTAVKTAKDIATGASKAAVLARRGFSVWPWIAGGAIVFFVVNGMFNPRSR